MKKLLTVLFCVLVLTLGLSAEKEKKEYKKVSITPDSIKGLSLKDLPKDVVGAAPNPGFSGNRVLCGTAVYFVMNDGYAYFLDYNTYLNLFRNWDNLKPYCDCSSNGNLANAQLIRPEGMSAVYLLANGKTHFLSYDVFECCQFNWDKVRNIPIQVFNIIPAGDDLKCTHL